MIARVVPYLALTAAAVYLLAVLAVMAIRVVYPYEIEWLEGAMVDHVARVVRGEPLYVPPSLAFVPFLYPPFYYYVSALVSLIAGEGLLALRLVSALSTVGVFGLVAWMAAQETGRRDAALVAAGLFAATFRIGGAWFDVGRVDMLWLFLLFAAFASARYNLRAWSFALTGVLLAAAFFTKQTAAVVGAPLVLWLIAARPMQGIGTAMVTAALAIGGTLLLNVMHDGWYWYYLVELPSNYRMHPQRIVNFFILDLTPIAVAGGLGVMALLTAGDWRATGFRLALSAGLFGAAVIGRSNDGGFSNVLIPAFAAVSLMAAIGYDAVRRALAAGVEVSSAVAAGPKRAAPRDTAWPSVLLLIQFGVLVFNPMAALPSAASKAAGDRLVAELRQSEGQLWVPYHGHLAARAGKPTIAHFMAVSDVLRYGSEDLRAPLLRQIEDALAERRFGLVVMSNSPFLFPMASLEAAYERRGPTFTQPDVFLPLTGSPRRPEWYYVPRSNP